MNDLNGLTDEYKYSLFIGQFLPGYRESSHENIIKKYLNNNYEFFVNKLFHKYNTTNITGLKKERAERNKDKNQILFLYSRFTLDTNCGYGSCVDFTTQSTINVNDQIINTNDTEYKIYNVTNFKIDTLKKMNWLVYYKICLIPPFKQERGE